MILELTTTPIVWEFDEYDQPYFLQKCEFQNEHVFDQISDVKCIVDISFDDMNRRHTDIMKLQCFDEDGNIILPDPDQDTEIRKQIITIMTNKL